MTNAIADAVMDEIRLKHTTVEWAETWQMACQAAEGVDCEVTDPVRIPAADMRSVTPGIVKVIGGQYLEHAAGVVLIACRREVGATRWECEIDRGSGWEDLPVR